MGGFISPTTHQTIRLTRAGIRNDGHGGTIKGQKERRYNGQMAHMQEESSNIDQIVQRTWSDALTVLSPRSQCEGAQIEPTASCFCMEFSRRPGVQQDKVRS
ncbi:hypothetical protein TNCV_4980661 [Trichonephila clavipes]|nr:hypothetical protein TNCV_4980661 [Trichonephila clavipes]